MGARGPQREFDLVVEAKFKVEQVEHLDRIAARAGVSRAAVIRSLVQDSLDKANGEYSPWPSIGAMAEAITNTTRQEN